MIRATIVSATIAALYAMWMQPPATKPPTWLEGLTPKVSQVDYCVITLKRAGRDRFGNWRIRWARDNGPCSLQDEYRNI